MEEAESSPGPARRRVDSKHLLVDAALEVIETKGVNALRIDELAASVGVTKGSLYWHFKDRDDLIRAALEEQLRRMGVGSTLDQASSAIEDSSNIVDYLTRIEATLTDPYDPEQVEQRWRRLELLASTRHDPSLSQVMREVTARTHEAWTILMRDAQARGILRSGIEPAAVAVALSAISLGSNVISVLGDEAPSRDEWFGLLAFLIAALAPERSDETG